LFLFYTFRKWAADSPMLVSNPLLQMITEGEACGGSWTATPQKGWLENSKGNSPGAIRWRSGNIDIYLFKRETSLWKQREDLTKSLTRKKVDFTFSYDWINQSINQLKWASLYGTCTICRLHIGFYRQVQTIKTMKWFLLSRIMGSSEKYLHVSESLYHKKKMENERGILCHI
jgi:hypothetical protein